jgi:hypothetical protein
MKNMLKEPVARFAGYLLGFFAVNYAIGAIVCALYPL